MACLFIATGIVAMRLHKQHIRAGPSKRMENYCIYVFCADVPGLFDSDIDVSMPLGTCVLQNHPQLMCTCMCERFFLSLH